MIVSVLTEIAVYVIRKSGCDPSGDIILAVLISAISYVCPVLYVNFLLKLVASGNSNSIIGSFLLAYILPDVVEILL